VAGEAVLVPLHQKIEDLECIYSLNETAATTWDLLDGSQSLRQVLDRIIFEYEVEPEDAAQDLLELVDQLVGIGALEKV